MLLSQVTGEDEAEAYRELSRRGAVDGIILHGARVDDPRIELLQELGLPFLMHGRASGTEAPYSWVDVNNRRAFRRACDFLLDLGHRRIALLNGLEFMDFAMRRRRGFEEAHVERGHAADPALITSTELTEGQGYAHASRMLDGPEPPTAFLASSIITGIGIRRALEERGLRLGRDVSVIIHDDDLSFMKNGVELPIFTATRSSVREAGRLAAEMLLVIIADPACTPQTRLLEAELIIGQSTGPAQQ
jgi:LacI family transcriptional regulator